MRTEQEVRARLKAAIEFEPENKSEAAMNAFQLALLKWVLAEGEDFICDDCKHGKREKPKHLTVVK